MTPAKVATLIPELLHYAEQMSSALGYPGAFPSETVNTKPPEPEPTNVA
jgi:hypothetical protein